MMMIRLCVVGYLVIRKTTHLLISAAVSSRDWNFSLCVFFKLSVPVWPIVSQGDTPPINGKMISIRKRRRQIVFDIDSHKKYGIVA